MRNYVETFQCNSTYNAVYRALIQITQYRKEVFVVATLSANKLSAIFLDEKKYSFHGFSCATYKTYKIRDFLHRLT